MKTAMTVFQLGAMGLILAMGVFFEGPLVDSLRQDPTRWISSLILFGFAPVCGLLLILVKPDSFARGSRRMMFVAHGAALISILWIVLWCFVWLVAMAKLGEQAEMYIKHMAYLHLFGVGFAMAAYAKGWMTSLQEGRSALFFMAVGWAVSYMAWFNLYLEPGLIWLWPPAVGGLFVVLGAFLISRQLKRDFEAASPQA